MFGTLNQFIEAANPKSLQYKNVIYQQDEQYLAASPLSKVTRKNTIQSRKKRTLSVVDNYKASNKAELFEKFNKNYPQILKIKKSSDTKQQFQLFDSRKSITQRKISSFFHGQNPNKMKDQIAKDQLKRQHNLLRAIVRTKMHEQQKIENTDYEDSFNRMVSGLKNIRIKPIVDGDKAMIEQQPKANRSLHYSVQKKYKSPISNHVRLEFQNCLNWTKKRKKDGSFYAKRLGKSSMKFVQKDQSSQNRKSMLQFIHQRSVSVDI